MKLHVLFFYICLFAAADFVSHVPLHRIPHCDIARSMIINKISTLNKKFNSFLILFILFTFLVKTKKVCFVYFATPAYLYYQFGMINTKFFRLVIFVFALIKTAKNI